MRTTVLGTGIMGAAMARSLAREGQDVAVWNRTPARAEAVAGPGISAHADLVEAVAGADVVLTMLYDADSVLDIVADLVTALGPDAVWVQSTTVGPEGMARIAEAAGAAAGRLLDAPVLGTKQPAETGNLTVLVSGPPAARLRAEPALDAVGARTLVVDDEIGSASALKLVCNSWVASINAATGSGAGPRRGTRPRPPAVPRGDQGRRLGLGVRPAQGHDHGRPLLGRPVVRTRQRPQGRGPDGRLRGGRRVPGRPARPRSWRSTTAPRSVGTVAPTWPRCERASTSEAWIQRAAAAEASRFAA